MPSTESREDSEADALFLMAWLDVEATILSPEQRIRLAAQLRGIQVRVCVCVCV